MRYALLVGRQHGVKVFEALAACGDPKAIGQVFKSLLSKPGNLAELHLLISDQGVTKRRRFPVGADVDPGSDSEDEAGENESAADEPITLKLKEEIISLNASMDSVVATNRELRGRISDRDARILELETALAKVTSVALPTSPEVAQNSPAIDMARPDPSQETGAQTPAAPAAAAGAAGEPATPAEESDGGPTLDLSGDSLAEADEPSPAPGKGGTKKSQKG